MLRYLPGVLMIISLVACSPSSDPPQDHPEAFLQELSDLQAYFSIPGVSAIVSRGDKVVFEQHLGYADLEKQLPVDSSTVFPIASVTKLFSAALIVKLAEEGKLSLDDPASTYLPEAPLDSSVAVKHLLSHTSQGVIGEQFFYSGRFGYLTEIIERASGRSFAALMQDRILAPLDLSQTLLLRDSLQLARSGITLAAPYVLDGTVQAGNVEYGYSASAGLVASARDLLHFSHSLDANEWLPADAWATVQRGLGNGLPYRYGLFSQNVRGTEVQWVYGQYDAYSSLLLRVPDQDLTLVLLANNNLMSDPARLIQGNVMSSLFAISFLKNFAFSLPEIPLLEHPDSVYQASYPADFYRQKVLAQALAESFLARFNPDRLTVSARLLEQTFQEYPNYRSYGDINLLHILNFLKTVAFYLELGEFTQFDEQLAEIGRALLEDVPNNPYVHVYLGFHYDRLGDQDQAAFHYRSILELENFSPSWYTREAESWFTENQ